MGADYYAKAVIGCEVTGKLTRIVQRPRCNHVKPDNAEFCPKCGKSTAPEDVKEPIPGYDPEDDPDRLTPALRQLATLTIAWTTDDERAFAGIQATTGSSRGSGDSTAHLPYSQIIDAKAKVKATLESLGLWDEASFGLWSVLYCSY